METLEMEIGHAIEPLSVRLLVADDHSDILTALEMLFDGQGYQVFSVSDPKGVLASIQAQTFDTVVMDLNYTRDTTGGAEGLELVSRIRSIDRTIPLLVMTAWGTIELAVEAMRRGASDFVQKPWDNSELLAKVQKQVEYGRGLRTSLRKQEEEALEAKQIQKSLLPRVVPQVTGYDIAATTKPVRFIGGDYYDIVQISDTQTAFCIADVAGKNNLFTYCNAGHNPPLLVRTNGKMSELKSSGAILGRFPDWHFTQVNVNLSRGDILLLFTDGVVEACDENDEPFGEQRLLQFTKETPGCSAAARLELLSKAVSKHCAGKFQDDATMIVLQATPSQPPPF